MSSKTVTVKNSEDCHIHGTPSRIANRTLLVMVLASLCLIIWRVWHSSMEGAGFFPLLGNELWNLVFDSHGILAELWDVLPYFIVGVLLAGAIRTYKIALKLQAKIRQYGFLSIFLASLVGILTPLCACGTLTTAISLLFAGLPLAPVMALLVTSPLLSPSTYLLTLNDLGPEWTVIRTVSAFAMGVFAGVVVHLLRNKGFRTANVFIEGGIPRGDFHDENYPDDRLRCNCKEKFGNRVAARTGNQFLVFLAKSYEMLWLVGKYVLVGVAIGAMVERYLPSGWIYRLFGQKDPLSILWITIGSVPIFLHQVSASSILYHVKSSLSGTLDNGAALAFLIGGPVTAMPTMILFWTVFKKRVFFLYLFVCLAGTILIASVFQFFIFVPDSDLGNPLLRGVRSVSGGAASILQKEQKNARMVMDPAGNGMIALYTNDVEGHGGMIFDGAPEKFLDRSLDRFDNRTYIQNVAEWLAENSTSAVPEKILIYHADAGMETDGLGLLDQNGFTTRVANRREIPILDEKLLAEYGQVWIFFGGADASFTSREEELLLNFSSDGKGILLVAGGRNAEKGLETVNRISSARGIRFAGHREHNEQIPVATGTYFLNRAAEFLGKILKIVHKA